MITENQLNEAIAECNGQRSPNASTCLKLASYYTIKRELFPDKREQPQIDGYSYAAPPVIADNVISYTSDTEFGKLVNGMDINDVLGRIDEVLKGVYIVDNSLYRRIMRDLRE